MKGTGTQSLLDSLSSEDDEDSSSQSDQLDTNGDGVIDATEAAAGMNNLIQDYLNQTSGGSAQSSASGGQINVLC